MSGDSSRSNLVAPSTRCAEVYVYGAGGHSQVVADVLQDMGLTVKAYINDDPSLVHRAITRTMPGVRLGRLAEFAKLDAPLVLAVGSSKARRELVGMLDVEWLTAIHSSATIASTATLGKGTLVIHRAIIQANAVIGNHVLVNTGASIDHDNVIGDYASISPHVTLCGNVHVGEGTFIGAGATVIPNVKIGKWCTIGAGTLVIRDIPDDTKAFGVPARFIK